MLVLALVILIDAARSFLDISSSFQFVDLIIGRSRWAQLANAQVFDAHRTFPLADTHQPSYENFSVKDEAGLCRVLGVRRQDGVTAPFFLTDQRPRLELAQRNTLQRTSARENPAEGDILLLAACTFCLLHVALSAKRPEMCLERKVDCQILRGRCMILVVHRWTWWT
ncbi:hypothetical protein DL98DRAFT_159020 [Cadophora sp. DSE1049]|nr:hypothetical protein DL98DRAFT_159020 [Cadophora sp. DSE1049]